MSKPVPPIEPGTPLISVNELLAGLPVEVETAAPGHVRIKLSAAGARELAERLAAKADEMDTP